MDKIHWRDYHSRHKTGMSASLLAKYVYENYLLEFTRDFNPIGKDTESLQDSNNPSEIWQHKDMQKILTILESNLLYLLGLGCENKYYRFYFSTKGIDVIIIDQVQREIEFLSIYTKTLQDSKQSTIDSKDTESSSTPPPFCYKNQYFKTNNLRLDSPSKISTYHKNQYSKTKEKTSNAQNITHFLAEDFIKLDDFEFKQNSNCIYSCFTLHSTSKKQQDKVIVDYFEYCKDNAMLATKTRSENNLCGKCEFVNNELNTFTYDSYHYRFLNIREISKVIKSSNFLSSNATQERVSYKASTAILASSKISNNTQSDAKTDTYATICSNRIYTILLFIALRFSMPKKTGDLYCLIIKFKLSQKRRLTNLNRIFTHYQIYLGSRQ